MGLLALLDCHSVYYHLESGGRCAGEVVHLVPQPHLVLVAAGGVADGDRAGGIRELFGVDLDSAVVFSTAVAVERTSVHGHVAVVCILIAKDKDCLGVEIVVEDTVVEDSVARAVNPCGITSAIIRIACGEIVELAVVERLSTGSIEMHLAVYPYIVICHVYSMGKSETCVLIGKGNISHKQAIEKAEKEFAIYRKREMELLESDFDKEIKKLKDNDLK